MGCRCMRHACGVIRLAREPFEFHMLKDWHHVARWRVIVTTHPRQACPSVAACPAEPREEADHGHSEGRQGGPDGRRQGAGQEHGAKQVRSAQAGALQSQPAAANVLSCVTRRQGMAGKGGAFLIRTALLSPCRRKAVTKLHGMKAQLQGVSLQLQTLKSTQVRGEDD